jgi:hypothetical protein
VCEALFSGYGIRNREERTQIEIIESDGMVVDIVLGLERLFLPTARIV